MKESKRYALIYRETLQGFTPQGAVQQSAPLWGFPILRQIFKEGFKV